MKFWCALVKEAGAFIVFWHPNMSQYDRPCPSPLPFVLSVVDLILVANYSQGNVCWPLWPSLFAD
jgi:hypothetical protein